MEYYINIMMENLDWGTLNVPFLDVEEISSGRDIDESRNLRYNFLVSR